MNQFRIQLLGETVSIKPLPFPDGDSHEFYVDDRHPDRLIEDVLDLLQDWHGVELGNADDHPEQFPLYLQIRKMLEDRVAFIVVADEQLMIRSVDPA